MLLIFLSYQGPCKEAPRDKPRLLDQVRDALRLRHYSIRTEASYLQWIKRFIFFHRVRHPLDMGEREITAFLTHLAVDRHVAPSTQNQARDGPVPSWTGWSRERLRVKGRGTPTPAGRALNHLRNASFLRSWPYPAPAPHPSP